MKIKSIKLTNFRNYRRFSVSFSEKTAFIGRNGVGKSNIIEAIRFLSLLKSFRTNKTKELINFKSSAAHIKASVEVTGQENVIDIGINHQKKILKHNKREIKNYELVGFFRTVVFSPDDDNFIDGTPAQRRKFLDHILSQKNREYLINLINYYKVLRHRNAALIKINKKQSDRDDLEIWNDQLLNYYQVITREREDLVNRLNLFLKSNSSKLFNKGSNVKIEYLKSQTSREILRKQEERDIALQATTTGAHRDDLKILFNEKEASPYASRGQRRIVMILIKTAELKELSLNGERPVFLLDDLFSELDSEHQDKVLDLAAEQQTVITATSLNKKAKSTFSKVELKA